MLSVVVPVYNGTPYLPQLIESLLAQKRAPDEVIFVDDGSTDGSGAMIECLGAGLTGLRVIRQKNQGQAVARNVGMHEASGRYLAFVDAADVLDAEMYVTLIGLAEAENLDIAMANAWNFHEGRKLDTLVYRDVPDTGVITGESWFQQRWLSRYLPHYCWMSVYRRSFVNRHGFAFPLADPHEDVIWVTETLFAAQRFHFVPIALHWYRKKKSEIAERETLQPVTRMLIRREFVNRGSHLVRQIRDLSDPVQRAHYLRRVREERFFRVLWRNASGLPQYWRVLRYRLLAYLLAMAAYLSLLRRRVVQHA